MEKASNSPSFINIYKEALKTPSTHNINGVDYSVKNIGKGEFYKSIRESLSDPSDFNKTVADTLNFAVNNSELFCGVSSQDYYQDKNQNIIGATEELSAIINVLINGQGENIKIPSEMKKIFSENKPNVTTDRIINGARRGFKASEKCQVCEQVDPIIGGTIHVASGILSKIIEPDNSELSQLWQNNYLESSLPELSNPKMVGFVDVLIKVVELNKEKYPNLDKFFGSEVEIPDFKGTYYDMVDTPEYQ